MHCVHIYFICDIHCRCWLSHDNAAFLAFLLPAGALIVVCINTLTVIHTFVQTAVVIEYFYCLYTYIKYVYICVHGQGINVYFILRKYFLFCTL